MATKLAVPPQPKPSAASSGQAGASAAKNEGKKRDGTRQVGAGPAVKPGSANAPAARGDAELARLRSIVEDQHRRLRVIRGQMPEEPPGDGCLGRFESRAAKPCLSRRTLGRLLEESRLRLELQDSALGAAIRAGWPEPLPAVPVLRPSPGLAAYALRDMRGVPNIVFALFGRSGGELKQAVERVIAEQHAGEPFIPVFLTNHNDFTAFREQRLAFEYFPFVLDDAADGAEPAWTAYILDTLVLSMRRWGVRQIMTL